MIGVMKKSHLRTAIGLSVVNITGLQKTGGIACTYIGYYGFDPCLYDECKICGQNEEINESELVST